MFYDDFNEFHHPEGELFRLQQKLNDAVRPPIAVVFTDSISIGASELVNWLSDTGTRHVFVVGGLPVFDRALVDALRIAIFKSPVAIFSHGQAYVISSGICFLLQIAAIRLRGNFGISIPLEAAIAAVRDAGLPVVIYDFSSNRLKCHE